GSRHPAIFWRHTAFSSPDGVDARTRGLHQTATGHRPQYRSPRRSETPAGAAVTSDSTCHNHCDEVLVYVRPLPDRTRRLKVGRARATTSQAGSRTGMSCVDGGPWTIAPPIGPADGRAE